MSMNVFLAYIKICLQLENCHSMHYIHNIAPDLRHHTLLTENPAARRLTLLPLIPQVPVSNLGT
jgi:hypothetical protein